MDSPCRAGRAGLVGVLLFLTGAAAAQDLITNGTFDDGSLSGWQTAGTQIYVVHWDAPDPRRTSAVLGYESNASQRLWQQVTIPPGTGAAALKYSWYVTTEETSHPYDQLDVRILDAAGNLLRNLETVTDAGPADRWFDRVVDVADLAGQTIRLEFRAATDDSLSTQFLVDDVSLVAIPGATAPRLKRIFLTDANDQPATQFRPGTTLRLYAEFEDVTRETALSLEIRYLTPEGQDLGGGAVDVTVRPAEPRARLDIPLNTDAAPADYRIRVSVTQNGRTDSEETAFSIVAAATASARLTRVYTADGGGQERTDFTAGEGIRLFLVVASDVAQSAALSFDVFDAGGTRVAALSGTGDVALTPPSQPWYLPATIPNGLAAGTYRYKGTLTAAGQSSSQETTFHVGTQTGGPAPQCDVAKAFVTNDANASRTAYPNGSRIRLHVCVLTNSTTAQDAVVRWLVDGPDDVAVTSLSGVGAVRATHAQPDWFLTRAIGANLPQGRYSLRAVVTMGGVTNTYPTSFAIGPANEKQTPLSRRATGDEVGR